MKTILIIALFIFGLLPMQADALYYNYCDKIFSESHFTDIERKDYPNCTNRFQYLTNKIKRDFINNYTKYEKAQK